MRFCARCSLLSFTRCNSAVSTPLTLHDILPMLIRHYTVSDAVNTDKLDKVRPVRPGLPWYSYLYQLLVQVTNLAFDFARQVEK